MERYEDGIMTQFFKFLQHCIYLGFWNESCGIGENGMVSNLYGLRILAKFKSASQYLI